jgi:protein tyrosine/serine phosphatase
VGFRNRVLRVYAIATLALASLAVPQIATSGPSSSSARPAIHIENFGSVNANYFRGAQPKGRDFADLASLGVKTVVDFQEDGDPKEAGTVEQLGMKFVRIPMNTRVVPTADQLTQFITLVNDPTNQPVFVHCAGGRHRTGVMTAVYRMINEGWTGARAFAEMKKYKFGADFLHPEFKAFVYSYSPPARVTAQQAAVAGTN